MANKIEWTPESIKALREHMGLTQKALAEKLGMRQQTISEWETGMYKPRRSTSKYLVLIAERAGFLYQVKSEEEQAGEQETGGNQP